MAAAGSDDADDTGAQPDPRAKLMQEVADQMDAIERDFGDNYQIGRVITLVEVTGSDGNVGLRLRANQLPWVTLGMLRFAEKIVEGGGG
jgi:hypothetical protein